MLSPDVVTLISDRLTSQCLLNNRYMDKSASWCVQDVWSASVLFRLHTLDGPGMMRGFRLVLG